MHKFELNTLTEFQGVYPLLIVFIDELLKWWAPRTQRYEDILHNLMVAPEKGEFYLTPLNTMKI
jgi:hypothetical protein